MTRGPIKTGEIVTVCPVCLLIRKRRGRLLCEPCGRSYDVARDRDMTAYATIVWASNRARLFDRRRRS